MGCYALQPAETGICPLTCEYRRHEATSCNPPKPERNSPAKSNRFCPDRTPSRADFVDFMCKSRGHTIKLDHRPRPTTPASSDQPKLTAEVAAPSGGEIISGGITSDGNTPQSRVALSGLCALPLLGLQRLRAPVHPQPRSRRRATTRGSCERQLRFALVPGASGSPLSIHLRWGVAPSECRSDQATTSLEEPVSC